MAWDAEVVKAELSKKQPNFTANGGLTWDLQDGSFSQASSDKVTTSAMTYSEAEVT